MPRDFDAIFDATRERYIRIIESNYRKRLQISRNRESTIDLLKQEANFSLRQLSSQGKADDLYNFFLSHYNRGSKLNEIFPVLKEMFGDVIPTPITRLKNEEKSNEAEYLSGENLVMKKIASNQKLLFKFLVKSMVYRDIIGRLPNSLMDASQSYELQKPGIEIKWTGEKGNKNEFVQLVYALHKAGLINNGKGEITKIVEEIAEQFNVELGKNWQSNLSSSIHKAKIGSSPEIFNRIKFAFEEYAKDLVEHKRKNS